jgi:hypothetical protein
MFINLIATALLLAPVAQPSSIDDQSRDYVVILDTSASMVTNEFFDPAKEALVDMINDDWSEDKKSRLYLYTFDSALRPCRVFDLDVEGKADLISYIDSIRALGDETCMVSALQGVLKEVPKRRHVVGRNGRVAYYLLTDGSENCRNGRVGKSAIKVEDGTLEKVLVEWGMTLERLDDKDHIFLLRLGSPIDAADIEIASLTEEEIRKASIKGDLPLTSVTTDGSKKALKEAMTLPSLTLKVLNSNQSVSEGGLQSIKCVLSGENLEGLDMPKLSVVITKSGFNSAPVSIEKPEINLTKSQWDDLVKGEEIELEFRLKYSPSRSEDIEEKGNLKFTVKGPKELVKEGTATASSTLALSSKGKAEVKVTCDPIAEKVARADTTSRTVSGSINLDWSSASVTRGGELTFESSGNWPGAIPPVVKFGNKGDGKLVVSSPVNSVPYSITVPAGSTSPVLEGYFVVRAIKSEIVSRYGSLTTELEIPWRLEVAQPPKPLVEVSGDFPVTGSLDLSVEYPEDKTTIRKRLTFSPNAEAKRKGAKIIVSSKQGSFGDPWPSGLKVVMDGEGGRVIHRRLDAMTCEIVVPRNCPQGHYVGVLELTSVDTSLDAAGFGEPSGEMHLNWSIVVQAPDTAVVSVEKPKTVSRNKIKWPVTSSQTINLPVRIDFNNRAHKVGSFVEANLSFSNPAITVSGKVRLTPSSPISSISINVPKGIKPNNVEGVLTMLATNATFPDNETLHTEKVFIEFDGSASLTATIGVDEEWLQGDLGDWNEDGYSSKTPITLNWSRDAKSLKSEIEYNIEPDLNSAQWPNDANFITLNGLPDGLITSTDGMIELAYNFPEGVAPGEYSGRLALNGLDGVEINMSGDDELTVGREFAFKFVVPEKPLPLLARIFSWIWNIFLTLLILAIALMVWLCSKWGVGPAQAWDRAKTSLMGAEAMKFSAGTFIEWHNLEDESRGEITLDGKVSFSLDKTSEEGLSSFEGSLTFTPVSGNMHDGIEVAIDSGDFEASSMGSKQVFHGGSLDPEIEIVCGDFGITVHGDFEHNPDAFGEDIANDPFDGEDDSFSSFNEDDSLNGLDADDDDDMKW